MSGFSAGWLALREPADVAARSVAVTRFVTDALHNRSVLRIVDLGSGTGSNVRYLSHRLPQPQQWQLMDNDPALLETARSLISFDVETRVADLRRLDASAFATSDLVTASALLDLVSEPWLRMLVEQCREPRVAVLAALNYDGRIECTPADEGDEFVCELVNRHQRTDKGFGPALGPDAGVRLEALLRDAGYSVLRKKSDWQLGASERELQRQLISGWAAAAIEMSGSAAERIRAWEGRRLDAVANERSVIVVGHEDVGAVPGGMEPT